jgi:hypothetical protein
MRYIGNTPGAATRYAERQERRALAKQAPDHGNALKPRFHYVRGMDETTKPHRPFTVVITEWPHHWTMTAIE